MPQDDPCIRLMHKPLDLKKFIATIRELAGNLLPKNKPEGGAQPPPPEAPPDRK